MAKSTLLTLFVQFGLAGLIGFLIGLEREMRTTKNHTHTGARDFTLFSLIGAVSAFLAQHYDNAWIIIAGFIGFMTLVISSYWAELRQGVEKEPGITTETSAILTFFLGVLIVREATEIAIALAIVTLAILSQKKAVKTFRAKIHPHEVRAVLKFLIITFIILPILPDQNLDSYLATTVAEVTAVDESRQSIKMELADQSVLRPGDDVAIGIGEDQLTVPVTITKIENGTAFGRYQVPAITRIEPGMAVRQYRLDIPLIKTMLSALEPYKIWLIVVLVSFISFIGYVLIKIIGGDMGIGLTGLIGGLVSSTVTTLSFSRRSKENPAWNQNFAVAIILASAVMFPRLWVEIAVVNQPLMKNVTLPLAVLAITGLILAGFHFFHSRRQQATPEEVSFDNPFSLKAAINFALVFSAILMITRLATTYLGESWLPVVAVVSGLTDADAIAFSLSDAHQAGTISLQWASINLVLGALSNTFMKLFLVLGLGHRGLFKHLLISFCILGIVGGVTLYLYYGVVNP